MRDRLATTPLPLDDTYVLVQCLGDERLDAGDYRAFLPGLASCIAARSIWSMVGGAFVMLVAIGRSAAAGFDDYDRAARLLCESDRLSECLENNGMRLFVSEPFDQLMLMPMRFAQTRGLVDAFDTIDDAGAVVLFWRYRFRVMAASVRSLDEADMMLDKRVLAMYRYDREHGTAYFDTAVVSVAFPGTPARAADELCVHRNTYFYRVGKIRELFDLDLKQGEDRLAVSFTEHVMKGMVGFPELP